MRVQQIKLSPTTENAVGRTFNNINELRNWILNAKRYRKALLNQRRAPPIEQTWRDEPFGSRTNDKEPEDYDETLGVW